MRDYLTWLDDKGFWVREAWSTEKNRMIGEGKLILFDIQRKILGHVLTFDENGLLPYETVLFSTVKKSGKTALSASVGAWYMEEAQSGTEIYVIANDIEQAKSRVFADLKFHFQKRNSEIKNYAKITADRIELKNGTFCQVLAQSFRSVAGSRHSLTLWDELWGVSSEQSRRTWDEMTPVPTVSNGLRFISTYAGFRDESDLLWDLYLRGVGPTEDEHGEGVPVEELFDLAEEGNPTCFKHGRMFTYWSHVGHMPWQTEEYYQEQLSSERPMAYMRLHMNQWVTSHDEFIPVDWWDRASSIYKEDVFKWNEHPFMYWPTYIGIDAGVRRDSTALVAVSYDAKRAKLGVLYHKIWTPSKDDPVDLDATVETEILRLYNRMKVVSIVYDPTHLMQMMMRLKSKGLPVKLFEQTIPNMTAASQLLYDLLKARNLEAYPSEELKQHIQMAVAETTNRGFRIVKDKASKRHHIDAAIALAMAAYDAVSNGGVDVSIPIIIRSPYSDATAWLDEAEQGIPIELRS
jgi:phage terminase large subunit-like protein